jgi:putative endonuclease
VNRGERRAARHYRLRGYRVIGANVRAGRNELDLVVRRGHTLLFVEVKERADDRYGGGFAAIGAEKRRRLRRAAVAWLATHPESKGLRIGFEAVAVQGRSVCRAALDVEAEG